MNSQDVIIVGGGVIGLGIAWRAALLGLHATVVDDHPGEAASWAAAGMLAPVTEVHYGEESLLHLNLESAQRYASFVDELESATGMSTGYRSCGTLSVAFDADDNAVLEDLYRFHQRLGLRVQRLRGSDCRKLESKLAPGVRGGLLVEDDNQINNRKLVGALLRAIDHAGAHIRRERVSEILVNDDQAHGVLLESGESLLASAIVLAAGCWSSAPFGLPAGTCPPVRPIKGQIIRLQAPTATSFLTHSVRALVHGSSVYAVARSNGEVVVGATVEEQGFDTRTTVEGIYSLLRDFYRLLPGSADLELVESRAALRPGSPDNAPLLGTSQLPGLILATGHYRNGILLTPITADAIASLLATGTPPPIIAPFSPLRFADAVRVG
ncbi:MAG: glycine oxidase ThiO [Chloroflexota bacterium]